MLALVMLVGAFTTHRGWKRNQQLATELDESRRQEEELKDLRVRFAALEAEKARWQDEREKLDKEARSRKDAAARLEQVEKSLLEGLRDDIAKGEVVLDRSPTRLKVRFAESSLFDPRGARISSRGKRLLARVGALLAATTGHHLEIAGHTDDSPVPGKLRRQFPTNWDLSAGRAAAVLHVLREVAKIPGTSPVASGHGSGQPLSDDQSSAGRARNRRIEMLLTPLVATRPDDKPPVVQARTAAPKKRPGPARRPTGRL